MKFVSIPKRMKYKKYQKNLGRATVRFSSRLYFSSGFFLKFDSFRLLKPNQLESCRRVLRRFLGRESLFSSKLVFNFPLTQKSSGVRMGKGRGSTKGWSSKVRKGSVLFMLSNVSYDSAVFALHKSAHKLNASSVLMHEPFFYKSRIKFILVD